MGKRVTWTATGWSDVERAAENIAKDSAYYAAALVRKVRQATRSLSRFPERGGMVEEIGDRNIREVFIHKYRLIYQVTKREAFILGFIHGARDLPALWKRQRRPGSEKWSEQPVTGQPHASAIL